MNCKRIAIELHFVDNLNNINHQNKKYESFETFDNFKRILTWFFGCSLFTQKACIKSIFICMKGINNVQVDQREYIFVSMNKRKIL